MEHKILLLFLIAVCLPTTLSQQCTTQSGQSQTDLLQTATIQVSSQQNLNADFSLRSFKKQRSFSVVLASSFREWKSYTVSFLVTSRDDLFLGNFIFNAFELTACGNSLVEIQSKYTIPNWTKPFASTQNVQVKLFLSGIRTLFSKNTTFVALGIKSASINFSSGQITYTLSNVNLNSFLTIQFNFMVISPTSFKYDLEEISLKSSGITSQQNFKTKPLYIFGGLFFFTSQKVINNQFNVISFTQTLVSCKGSKCQRSCVSKRQCIQKQGRITTDSKGIEQCLLECGQNEVYNSQNQCECIYGFEKRKGTCQKIPQQFNCSSSQFYNFTTTKCDCKSDFIFVGTSCRTRCNVNGYINSSNSQCTCLPGYRLFENSFCHNCEQRVDNVNKRCLCLQPQFYMALNGSCIRNTCKPTFSFFPAENRCGCQTNQVQVNGTCFAKCGTNQYTFQNSCICVPGFTFVEAKNGCFKKVVCTKINEIPSQSGYDCICKDGFDKDQSDTCVPKCPANEVLSLNKQTCDCEKGLSRNSLTKLCQANCATNQIYDKNVFSCRCKDGFVRDSAMTCILQSSNVLKNCPSNEQFSQSTLSCVCIKGFDRTPQGICQLILPILPTKVCPINSILKNNECVCNSGFAKIGESCINICGINEIYNDKTLSCQCMQGFGRIANVCRQCPVNSTTKNSACFCSLGLKWIPETNSCEISCLQNSLKTLVTLANTQNVFICQCASGYVQNAQGQCLKIPDPVCPSIPTPPVVPPSNAITCPGTSVWDPLNFRCFCNSSILFFMNGTCRPCESNQGWNGTSCVCSSGFSMINSKCLKCDINSLYRGGKCICNFGFYDENPNNIQNTSCKACHISCGTCTGPQNTECLTCSDPEAIFSGGKCTSNPNCPKGFFNSTSGCQKCSEYCNKCKDENECTECVTGFSIERVDILGTISAFCPEICGDGKRFEYECDDGNLNDGDGCDSGCFIEKGWTCNAGSPTIPSVCIKSTETRAILTITKPLRMIGQISQGATLSYIPETLSQNLCVKCNDILLVRLVSYTIQPSVVVSYIPTTRFKFSINFSFSGIFAIPDFVYSVQINPKYEKYFLAQDMAQRLIVPVVTADLSLDSPDDILTLDLVQNPTDTKQNLQSTKTKQ